MADAASRGLLLVVERSVACVISSNIPDGVPSTEIVSAGKAEGRRYHRRTNRSSSIWVAASTQSARQPSCHGGPMRFSICAQKEWHKFVSPLL